jgi:hypothetical protein
VHLWNERKGDKDMSDSIRRGLQGWPTLVDFMWMPSAYTAYRLSWLSYQDMPWQKHTYGDRWGVDIDPAWLDRARYQETAADSFRPGSYSALYNAR